MIPFRTVITHPGGAHKDEFLACSVLLAFKPVTVERREPTPDDLADPSLCVVDVGHQHNPALNNFDHHQLPRDQVPTCSLSLVLQALDLYKDAREFCEWLEPTEWFDCRGPFATADWLGVSREVLARLNSPIEITLLRRFSLAERLAPGDPLWEIMLMIGVDLLDYLKSLRARLNFISAHAEVWDLGLTGTPGKILFLPRTTPLPDDPSAGMDRYIESRGWTNEIIGTVAPDRRGTGYGLSRFRDNAVLDFTRIAASPEVHFAHARGFVAKTSATSPARLRALLLIAATPPKPERVASRL